MGSKQENKVEETNLSDDQGSGKLIFTGPGYTINLVPQAILLGILSFLAVFAFGLLGTGGGETSSYGSASGYGAPEASYGAPSPSYGAPAQSYGAPAASYDAPSSGYNAARYYDTYSAAATDPLNQYEDTRRKRSAF